MLLIFTFILFCQCWVWATSHSWSALPLNHMLPFDSAYGIFSIYIYIYMVDVILYSLKSSLCGGGFGSYTISDRAIREEQVSKHFSPTVSVLALRFCLVYLDGYKWCWSRACKINKSLPLQNLFLCGGNHKNRKANHYIPLKCLFERRKKKAGLHFVSILQRNQRVYF